MHSSISTGRAVVTCAVVAGALLFAGSASAAVCQGLTGVVSGGKIHYTAMGKLNSPFGSLPAGAPITAKLVYSLAQTSSPAPDPKGNYRSFKIKVRSGSQQTSDSGPGTINIYDKPSFYPTDMFHAYNTTPVTGTLGGLNLASGAGLQISLQNLPGTGWSSVALPGAGLTMANLTAGNGTFIELRSTTGVSARANLCP
jgi:hypothetical protein